MKMQSLLGQLVQTRSIDQLKKNEQVLTFDNDLIAYFPLYLFKRD